MSKPGYALLQDVIMDPDFPDLDLALRRGRHVDREDAAWYALLHDAQEQLELFYRRYGCELIHKTDGYFYLLPTSEKISRKQVSPSDMLVGQALALLYLDPANIERGGVIAHEDLIAQLSSVLGTDALIAAFNPGTSAGKRKKYDERIAQRNVRSRVAESVRRLAAMGFVDIGTEIGSTVGSSDDERVRLRPALMRFAEPVRGLSEPAEALARLVAQGEVALTPEEAALEAAADSGEEPASGVTPRPVQANAEQAPADSDDQDELSADGESSVEQDAPELAADAESSYGRPEEERETVADAESVAPEIQGDELSPDAESSDPDAALEADGEAAPAAADGGEAPAEPVHPMDRDLDWADILPDAEEPA